MHVAERSEGKGGQARHGSTPLLLRNCVPRGFYVFNSYRMGQTRHTSPSLRLFHPEQPNGVSSFLSSVGWACNVSFLWLGSFRGDRSPTTTSAPFLDQLVSSGFLISFQPVPIITIIQILLLYSLSLSTQSCKVFSSFSSLFFNTVILSFLLLLSHTTVGAVTHGVVSAPTYPALTLCKISFFVLEEVYSTRSISLFFVTH
jgi:hypothetical protein